MDKRILVAVVIAISLAFILTGFWGAEQTIQKSSPVNLIPVASSGVIANGIPIAGINTNEIAHVVVTLHYRNSQELNVVLAGLQNPASPMYHKYLTRQQFISMFSPSISEYFSYVAYFQKEGFAVKTYGDRTSMVLTGNLGQFQNVFHTQLATFSKSGGNYYAPVSQMYLSFGTSGAISSVVGLNTGYTATISPLFTGSGSSQLLYGADMQAAYQLNKIFAAKGYPTGETIATILWSGTNSAGTDVAPYVPSDITHYLNTNTPSGEPRSTVYGYPINGAPPPGPSAANDNTQADYESTLDLEMAGSAAPGATVVEVYGPSATQSNLDQAFAAVLNPSYNTSVNNALSHVVAISNSWGGSDTNDSTWMQYEQQAAARGITVLASSGDNGNTNSVAPSFPATMSYNDFGTLAVGGAAMQLTGSTSTDGSGTTGISTQSVWYNTPSAGDGSQGGVSTIFAEPVWQQNSADANSVITAVSSGRGTPDVAADGANMEIYITAGSTTSYQELWGTSVASPLTAGVIADMNLYLGSNEGFINPELYRLAQAEVNGTLSNAPMYFISNGSNGAYSANNGYSLAVGWGSFNAYNFVQDQLGATPAATYTVTFTESGLASGTSWSVTLGSSTQSSTGSTISFTEPNGTYSYTVGSVSGYTSSPSSGSVTVSGANQGVSITFTASTSSGTNGIYAEVNATSANIATYNLPEAEQFNVGSTSQSINYVVLYLSGSGSVQFGIGTSLWGSNVVPFTTVNVNSNTLWYNTSIPAVTLTGGTNYYLTVEGSGSIQWGYASTTSVDLHATQDYWYSSPPSNGMPSGTPTNDNSYPNIFTVGYHAASSTPPPAATYTVTFTESGLASGTSWSVTLGSSTQSSTGSTISFTEPNGTYSYTVGSVSGYTSSPSSGSVTVSGANQGVSVTFTATQASGVWAQVTATSANTAFYTLPEAEKFTVGSTNEPVNFVNLFLEGTGTITVGIGTSLFTSNVVANITVSVSQPSSGGWQNVTFPSVTLTGGTHYFLNVNEPSGSGNVQWGYTTSPSTDVNALQDYWYSGSTLYHDNSYPDLFNVGYSSAGPAVVNHVVNSSAPATSLGISAAIIREF
ncbi:MAG: protease pro-enzyme activation domain-containing protein [Thermoplasmataceae archaeon]